MQGFHGTGLRFAQDGAPGFVAMGALELQVLRLAQDDSVDDRSAGSDRKGQEALRLGARS
jgi:hypothetical protein